MDASDSRLVRFEWDSHADYGFRLVRVNNSIDFEAEVERFRRDVANGWERRADDFVERLVKEGKAEWVNETVVRLPFTYHGEHPDFPGTLEVT